MIGPLAASDVVLDVGCGKGKVLFEVLKQNPEAHGVGVELTKSLCRVANLLIGSKSGLHGRATIYNADIRDPEVDLSVVRVCVVFFVSYGLEASELPESTLERST